MTDETTARVKKEFLVERQGRTFVLVNGLLDLAHQEGLSSIQTELILPGTEVDGVITWLFKATVTTKKGTFTGYGDATAANVTRAMLTVLPRFAETRSLARALRFATNVGAVALEEMGPDSLDDAPATVKREFTPVASPAANGPPADRRPPTSADRATDAQIRACYAIGRDQYNLSEQEVDEKATSLFGLPPSELSKRQASEFITSLNAGRQR